VAAVAQRPDDRSAASQLAVTQAAAAVAGTALHAAETQQEDAVAAVSAAQVGLKTAMDHVVDASTTGTLDSSVDDCSVVETSFENPVVAVVEEASRVENLAYKAIARMVRPSADNQLPVR
jgi:hypothetical protein